MSWDEAQLDSIAAIGKISDLVTPLLPRLLRKGFFGVLQSFAVVSRRVLLPFFWRSEVKKTP